ncbi:hypothetical protein CJ260_11340 [Megasphaera sp. ASD88]|uniref:hypothetical protein n=1 Tax=Megasphaera sp. ASD88 TaxID=2027407 RepID=UPI000BABB274|nr:hypothetical protein [Megasphaera sp. ASD88]PAV38035.1 hypothetical protein CJ260_11340 [Megasphaera sp. ASD88]
MKISQNLKELTTTQVEFARALGITQPRVHQLIADGIVTRSKTGGVLVIDSLKNYYQAKSGTDEGGTVDYWTEKAKHEKTKREMAEINLAKMEGSVYDAKVVEMVLTEMLVNLRTQLLGLPAALAPQLEGRTKEEIYVVLTSKIEEKLAELSEYTPDLFTEETIGDGDGSENGE